MYLAHEDLKRFWERELVWDPDRVRAAAKISLAVVICISIGLWFHLPRYDWMLITISVLMVPTVGASTEKSVCRIIGTFIGAFAAVCLVSMFFQHHLLFSIVLFLFIFVCVYGGSGTFMPYAFFVLGMTCMVVAISSATEPTQVVSIAGWRGLEITLGVVVIGLITVYLWPVYAHKRIEANLREVSLLGSRFARKISRALFDGETIGDDWRQRELDASGLIVGAYGLLRHAGLEDERYKLAQNALTSLVLHFETFLADLDAARRIAKEGLPEGLHKLAEPELRELFEQLARRLERLGEQVVGNRVEPAMEPLEAAWQAAEKRLDALRAQGRQFDYPMAVSTQVHTILAMVGRMVASLREIENALMQRDRLVKEVAPRRGMEWAEIHRQVLTYDRDRMRVGLIIATALSMIFAVLQPNLFPQSFTIPLIISILIGTKTTMLSVTPRSAWLMLGGSAFGVFLGFFSIVYVFPNFEGVFGFILWTALIIFLCAYLAFGSPAYALAGAQPMIPYVLMTATVYAPAASVQDAGWTAAGWLLGTSLVLLPIAAFWPAQYRAERRRILWKLWARWGYRLPALTLPEPDLMTPEELANRKHQVLAQIGRANDLCIETRLANEESAQVNAEVTSMVRISSNTFFKIAALEDTLRGFVIEPDEGEVVEAFNAYLRVMGRACDEVGAAIREQRRPQLPEMGAERAALEAALDRLAELRQGQRQQRSFRDVSPLLALVEGAHQVEEGIHLASDSRLRLLIERGELSIDTVLHPNPAPTAS